MPETDLAKRFKKKQHPGRCTNRLIYRRKDMASQRSALSLDELISQLLELRNRSPLKGLTEVRLSILGHEYQSINEVMLAECGPGSPVGVVLIKSDTLDRIVEDLDMEATLDEIETEKESDSVTFTRKLKAEIARQEGSFDPEDVLLHSEPTSDDSQT